MDSKTESHEARGSFTATVTSQTTHYEASKSGWTAKQKQKLTMADKQNKKHQTKTQNKTNNNGEIAKNKQINKTF